MCADGWTPQLNQATNMNSTTQQLQHGKIWRLHFFLRATQPTTRPLHIHTTHSSLSIPSIPPSPTQSTILQHSTSTNFASRVDHSHPLLPLCSFQKGHDLTSLSLSYIHTCTCTKEPQLAQPTKPTYHHIPASTTNQRMTRGHALLSQTQQCGPAPSFQQYMHTSPTIYFRPR